MTNRLTVQRWGVVSATALIALVLLSALLEQPKPCGPLPEAYTPIIAFELMRTEVDLERLFI